MSHRETGAIPLAKTVYDAFEAKKGPKMRRLYKRHQKAHLIQDGLSDSLVGVRAMLAICPRPQGIKERGDFGRTRGCGSLPSKDGGNLEGEAGADFDLVTGFFSHELLPQGGGGGDHEEFPSIHPDLRSSGPRADEMEMLTVQGDQGAQPNGGTLGQILSQTLKLMHRCLQLRDTLCLTTGDVGRLQGAGVILVFRPAVGVCRRSKRGLCALGDGLQFISQDFLYAGEDDGFVHQRRQGKVIRKGGNRRDQSTAVKSAPCAFFSHDEALISIILRYYCTFKLPLMPDSSASKPKKRVRLTPWRGPFHFLLLLTTSSLTLMLPFAYILMVIVLGFFVGWLGFEWVTSLALAESWHWRDALPILYVAAGGVTWIFMLRPLMPRSRSIHVALQITPSSQPRLFELVDEICWHLRLDPPEEIWLDTTIGIRSSVRDGVLGVAGGELILHIGLPIVSVVNAREFTALLVRELAMNAGGLGTTFSHLVRELNTWFYRALHERDPWELELRVKREKETPTQRLIRISTWLWMGVAKVPFGLFVIASRLISVAALVRLASGADRAAMNVIGKQSWKSLHETMQLLQGAWDASRTEIQRGLGQHRLPDNLALLLARHVTRASRQKAPPVPTQAAKTPAASLVEEFPEGAPAASLIRGFVDLSRQVTCFYYQHELGIGLHEIRLVADEEVIHQNRREDESLVIIRRYFGGLAHPERAMCGLGATHQVSPGQLQLQDEILRVREEIREWGSRLKLALQEWNLAWQRRRDLEAAAVLSLAGFTISRIQFGTDDTTPQSLRGEAARQRMLMEHMETALAAYEVKLESRFAAALGLLWWVDKEQLDDRLKERRQDLPAWVSIYEAMAGALPSFRELLTTFFAFQTLGARYTSQEETTSVFTALQSVVPKMTNLLRQILSTMDGAMYPFAPNKRSIPLNDYLLQGKLPEPVNISMNPGAAVDTKVLSAKMAADASEVIAPFVDRFLQLYHKSYAWLAESAELTEMHFLGPISFGADTELLMPEEFAKMHDNQPMLPKSRLPTK